MGYKLKLKEFALFELKSLLGRVFFNTKPKFRNESNYLNLGCGGNYVNGYINADFFNHFKFWKKTTRKYEWQLDLRYKLKCEDDMFDGIFSEHTLEHLYPDDAKRLLSELYRVLKKNSFIRITVPDIEKYIRYYSEDYDGYDSKIFHEKFQTGCEAIRNVTQDFLHVSIWDFDELKRNLEEVGFREVVKKEFGDTQDERLNLDIQDRSWETLYVEAKK